MGEFAMDQMFSTTEQWGLDDTMLDLMMDTTGALIFSLIALVSMRNGSFERAMRELDESAARRYASEGTEESARSPAHV